MCIWVCTMWECVHFQIFKFSFIFEELQKCFLEIRTLDIYSIVLPSWTWSCLMSDFSVAFLTWYVECCQIARPTEQSFLLTQRALCSISQVSDASLLGRHFNQRDQDYRNSCFSRPSSSIRSFIQRKGPGREIPFHVSNCKPIDLLIDIGCSYLIPSDFSTYFINLGIAHYKHNYIVSIDCVSGQCGRIR